MKTIVLDQVKQIDISRDQYEYSELVDLGWPVARLTFDLGHLNSSGVFVKAWQEPPQGAEVVRVLKHIHFLSGPDSDGGPGQFIYINDETALLRLRDALLKAMPLEPELSAGELTELSSR